MVGWNGESDRWVCGMVTEGTERPFPFSSFTHTPPYLTHTIPFLSCSPSLVCRDSLWENGSEGKVMDKKANEERTNIGERTGWWVMDGFVLMSSLSFFHFYLYHILESPPSFTWRLQSTRKEEPRCGREDNEKEESHGHEPTHKTIPSSRHFRKS